MTVFLREPTGLQRSGPSDIVAKARAVGEAAQAKSAASGWRVSVHISCADGRAAFAVCVLFAMP